jgi:hypothetical protein
VARFSSSFALRLLILAFVVLAASHVAVIARLLRAEATIRELRSNPSEIPSSR